MLISPVTLRYATALFELARDKSASAEVERDVMVAGEALADPQVASFFEGADVPLDKKRARLEQLGVQLHPLVRNLLLLLADKGRLTVLPQLAEAYRRCVYAERGIVEGVVESPRPLPDAELKALEAALGARLSKEVRLKGRVQPELLAGARVVVDNRLLDASAQGRLEALRTRLLGARLTAK